MIGTIFDIKEMAIHDGPGIRTTLFFKGCPLRCKWCHNPEGLSSTPQLMFKQARCVECGLCKKECNHPDCKEFDRCLHICPQNALEISGRSVTPEQISKELIESSEILGDFFGGFTFSGGEPTAQPKFLFELANLLEKYHLCIETSGYCESDIWEKVIQTFDFIIMDIKLVDEKEHIKYTGVSNEKIIQNFITLSKSGKPFIIRTPLIPNITDTKENLEAIKEIIGDSKWEQLPYNAVAGAKYKMLGMEYEL